MFPDSNIASDFLCKDTKIQTIICEALCPYHEACALKFPFSLLCDESNEKGDTVKLLTILIRSYECENSSVVTKHVDTMGITCVTAADIFNSIKNVVLRYGLDFSNLIAFASETCNVMKDAWNGTPNLCVMFAVKALLMKHWMIYNIPFSSQC